MLHSVKNKSIKGNILSEYDLFFAVGVVLYHFQCHSTTHERLTVLPRLILCCILRAAFMSLSLKEKITIKGIISIIKLEADNTGSQYSQQVMKKAACPIPCTVITEHYSLQHFPIEENKLFFWLSCIFLYSSSRNKANICSRWWQLTPRKKIESKIYNQIIKQIHCNIYFFNCKIYAFPLNTYIDIGNPQKLQKPTKSRDKLIGNMG